MAEPATKKSIAQGQELEQHLAVGLVSMLRVASPTGLEGHRLRTAIRGWQKGRYVLLDLLPKQSLPTTLRSGASCVIRFVSRGTVCGFASSILDIVPSESLHLMRLNWPEEISEVRVREHERHDVEIPCTITAADGNNHAGTIHDLCASGCRVWTTAILDHDTLIALEFVLPDGSAIEGLGASVRNINPVPGGCYFGCQFEDTSEGQAEAVGFYVLTALEWMRGKTPVEPHILVLERDEEIGETLAGSLRGCGYEVTVASTVADGLYLARMARPDALLINQEQGIFRGADVCRELRSSSRFKDLSIVLYGDGAVVSEKEALDAGATSYIPLADMRKDIARMFGRAPAEAPAEETPED